MACPGCGAERYQVRDGKTAAGSQRVRCRTCEKRYTPHPNVHGYDPATRAAALRMVADGINLRRAERLLLVHHTTILRWKRQAAARVAARLPQPSSSDEIALDELSTFVQAKKTGSI